MDVQPKSRSLIQSILYHSYTIWLFTFSDLKTVILPTTLFAISHSVGSSAFGVHRPDDNLVSDVVRMLLAATWIWLNLLAFVLGNQRQSDSIAEDKLNKPWRPLAAGRISQQQATRLMILLYPTAVIVSTYLGAPFQSLTLVALGVWYNDFHGSGVSWAVRHFINACGYICVTSGAFQIITRQSILTNSTLTAWFAIIGLVIFTTMHVQDFADQAGDSLRGRNTVPLVLGDELARRTVALPILFWSWFCPHFWSVMPLGSLVSITLGTTIVYRILTKKSIEEDKATFRLWSLWLILLYSLPWIRSCVL